ncbi:phosphopyruvate hydratase [Cellulomonas carbonis]|nr:phosphopyruvate hydratase [Cellulomonas carbonis]
MLDCGGRPLVEVDVRTDSGHVGRGAAPTGHSVGAHEAFVLRDDDPSRYDGRSVHRAVRNVEEVLAPALVGRDVSDQAALDTVMIELDGTPRKTRLGGNAIYSVSIACLRAAAACAAEPVYRHLAAGPLTTVPVPAFNVVNGGRHGALVQAYNEFLVVPHGAEDIFEAVEIGVRVFEVLGGVLERRFRTRPGVGKSYGFVAPSSSPRVVLDVLRDAADACGVLDKVAFAVDCASSEMYDRPSRTYELDGRRTDAAGMVEYAAALTEEFALLFVEDLLDEDDWDGFALAARELTRTLVLGDDLVVTNSARLRRAIDERAVDGFLLKPNQVGTITQALEAFEEARRAGLVVVPSGRSGGVIDDVVMDLAVGLQVPFLKNGAPRSGERIEKLNFLMRAAHDIEGCRLADVSAIARFPDRTADVAVRPAGDLEPVA